MCSSQCKFAFLCLPPPHPKKRKKTDLDLLHWVQMLPWFLSFRENFLIQHGYASSLQSNHVNWLNNFLLCHILLPCKAMVIWFLEWQFDQWAEKSCGGLKNWPKILKFHIFPSIWTIRSTEKYNPRLKADRPHSRNYLHTSTDYRHTAKHGRLIMGVVALCCNWKSRAPNINRYAPKIWPLTLTCQLDPDLWPWHLTLT